VFEGVLSDLAALFESIGARRPEVKSANTRQSASILDLLQCRRAFLLEELPGTPIAIRFQGCV